MCAIPGGSRVVNLSSSGGWADAHRALAAADSSHPINGYGVKATLQHLEKLAMAGFDVTEGIRGKRVEIFGTSVQIATLKSDGIKATIVRDRKGRTAAQRQRARMGARAAQAPVADDSAYQVWTPYDRVRNDGKEQYLEQYDRLLRQYPKITKELVLGRTHQDREIVAIKVTRNARKTQDGRRPAVLYNAEQHAREWLAGETCRRTLDYFVTNYGDNARVTRLVDTCELWFMCIANPDGHEYTFTPGNRLWRKNMADNDGDGVRGEPNDGVDPNRNFATNFGLDDEGSSYDPSSETYRGSGPDSEPETKAMKKLWDRVDFAFQKNDHTAAERCCGRRASRSSRPRPTTASSRRWAAPTTRRRSRTTRSRSTPTCRRSSTSPTATRSTTATTSTASSASRPRAPTRASRASPASSSRTTSRRCRRSSSATLRSRSISRSRRPIRRTRTRISATRRRTSTSTRSTSRTAIRSPSGSTTRRSRSTARRRRSRTSSPTPAAGSSGRHPRSTNPVVGWERVTEEFQEGAVVATDDTVYSGFGFEGISTQAKRNEFMRGVLRHLGIL